jgi:aspartate aminotransferase-like enzyme
MNLTTGPIEPSSQVLKKLGGSPIPHRSSHFQKTYDQTISVLKEKLSVKRLAILQGSGTLANEAMLWQIKRHKGFGLILSNGEFGERLMDQATRIGLKYHEVPHEWGMTFDLQYIQEQIESHQPSWVLFVHCETSSGVVTPLEGLCKLSAKYKLKTYVDCISTVGCCPLSLNNVTMATGSSGKGLGSIPGLSFVASNIPFSDQTIPKYIDLKLYDNNSLPFTHSSNQIEAFYQGIRETMNEQHWSHLDELSRLIYEKLSPFDCIPFATPTSRVYTISNDSVREDLKKIGVRFNHENEYLQDRGWSQIALMGHHEKEEIESILFKLEEQVNCKKAVNPISV